MGCIEVLLGGIVSFPQLFAEGIHYLVIVVTPILNLRQAMLLQGIQL